MAYVACRQVPPCAAVPQLTTLPLQLSFETVVLKGLAADGGLFLPHRIPRVENWVLSPPVLAPPPGRHSSADNRLLARVERPLIRRTSLPHLQLVHID